MRMACWSEFPSSAWRDCWLSPDDRWEIPESSCAMPAVCILQQRRSVSSAVDVGVMALAGQQLVLPVSPCGGRGDVTSHCCWPGNCLRPSSTRGGEWVVVLDQKR